MTAIAAWAEPVASWMSTYAVHSTLLLGAAWLLGRALGERRLALQETAWKVALVGGLLTATLQLGLGLQPLAGTWSLTPGNAVAATAPGELPAAVGIPAHSPATTVVAESAVISTVAAGSAPRLAALPAAAAPEQSTSTTAAAAVWPVAAVSVWLAVAALLLTGLAISYLRLTRRLADRWPVTGGALRALFGRLIDRSRRRRPVRLTATRRLGIPIAWGLARPEITLPEPLVHGLSPYHQESILAHELAHLARRDPLWLACGRVVECALFFQPLNRVARRRLQEIAEYRCDDRAVELTGKPLELARCLTEVAAWRLDEARGLPVSAMASRSGLGARVRRLADRSRQAGDRSPHWFAATAVAAVLLVALAAPAITGQEAPPAPAAPEAPNAAEAPPAPEALPAPPVAPAAEAPTAPEPPATSELPTAPELPTAVPATPELPAAPELPTAPQPSTTPELPTVPETPAVAPSLAPPAPLPEAPTTIPAPALPTAVPTALPRPSVRVAVAAAPRPILVSTGGIEEPGDGGGPSGLTSGSRAEREAALSRLEAELDTLEARIDAAVERHEEALEALAERTGEEREDDAWDEHLEAGLERLEAIHERIADELAAGLETGGAGDAEMRAVVEGHLREAFRAQREVERELARLHAETARLEAGGLHGRLHREERDAAREEARRHAELARREVERELARHRELRGREMARVRDELRAVQEEIQQQNRAVAEQSRELAEQNRELERMQREELEVLARELADTHRAAAEARVAGDEQRREALERRTEQLETQLEAVQETMEEQHQELLQRSLELREQTLETLHEQLEQMNEQLEQEMEAKAEAMEQERDRDEP